MMFEFSKPVNSARHGVRSEREAIGGDRRRIQINRPVNLVSHPPLPFETSLPPAHRADNARRHLADQSFVVFH